MSARGSKNVNPVVAVIIIVVVVVAIALVFVKLGGGRRPPNRENILKMMPQGKGGPGKMSPASPANPASRP
jgi:hypothetical protein